MVNANIIDQLLLGMNSMMESLLSRVPWGDPLHSQGKGQGQITVFRQVFDVLGHHPVQMSSGNKGCSWQDWPQRPPGSHLLVLLAQR